MQPRSGFLRTYENPLRLAPAPLQHRAGHRKFPRSKPAEKFDELDRRLIAAPGDRPCLPTAVLLQRAEARSMATPRRAMILSSNAMLRPLLQGRLRRPISFKLNRQR